MCPFRYWRAREGDSECTARCVNVIKVWRQKDKCKGKSQKGHVSVDLKNSIRDARTPQLYKGPNNVKMEKIMSKRMHVLYLHLAWPNYDLDDLNITMHTEVVIHSMNAYVWCWSKICGSLDEIPSVTMGSCKSKILNEF